MAKAEETPGQAVLSSVVKKDYKLKGFVRKTAPPYINPMDMPEGTVIVGEILGVKEGEVKKKGGKSEKTISLHLKTDGGTEIYFPVGSVLETALGGLDKLPGVVGTQIAIKSLGARVSPTYKRPYFNCEVWLSED